MTHVAGKRKRGHYPVTNQVTGEELLLPSVTTVLDVIGKPNLYGWYAKTERDLVKGAALAAFEAGAKDLQEYGVVLGNKIGEAQAGARKLRKAASIGTMVHKLIEHTLVSGEDIDPGPHPGITPEAKIAYDAWNAWRKEIELVPTLMEQTIYSLEYGYAGTLDFYGTIDGQPVIIDWKTSSGIYPEAVLQEAAYWDAFCRMQPDIACPTKGMIVRLPKTEEDSLEVREIDEEECDTAFNAFLHALALWKWLRGERR